MASMEKDDGGCLNGRDDAVPLKPECQTESNLGEFSDQPNGQKLWVIYTLSVLPLIGIAMNVTSTWSYLQKIDPEVSPTFFGWANFGFYCSAIATDVAIGRWMHFRASSREPLVLLCFIQILAVLLYVFAQGVGGQGGLGLVLAARILLGTLRGMMTLTRTLISYSTNVKQRSQAMANIGISQTAGFFIGSGIQAAISQIGERSFYLKSLKLHFNLYTIPSYLVILIAMSTIILVWYHIKPVSKQPCTPEKTPEVKKDLIKREICAGGCLVLLFTLTSFAASSAETLTIPFVQHQFSLTESEAVWYGGIVLTVQAVIATLQQGNIKILLKRFTDRWLIRIGYASLCLAFMLFIPIGSVATEMPANNSTLLAGSNENIGCPRRYDWCSKTPRIWLPQYILGAVFQASGLSFSITLVLSLYTKVLAGRNQGSSLGFISAAGNFGRLIAPIASSSSYVAIGPQFTYLWAFLALSLGMVYYIAVYKDMHEKRSPACDDTDLKIALNSRSTAIDTFYVTTV